MLNINNIKCFVNKNTFLKLFDLFVIPIVIFIIGFNINSLHGLIDPLEIGHYLSCGNGIFYGEVPYKDFIPSVGPLFIWLLALVMKMLGKTIMTLYIYIHLTTIATYIILYILAREVCKHRIFIYLVPLLSLIETFNPFWSSRWSGYSRMGVGLLGIFLLMLFIKRERKIYLFLSGIIGGLGLLYSIDTGTFILLSGFFLIGLLYIYNYNSGKKYQALFYEAIRHCGIFLLGFFSIFLPFIIYLCLKEALIQYIETAYFIMKYHISVWQTGFPSLSQAFMYYKSIKATLLSDVFKIHMPRFFYLITIGYIIFSYTKKKNKKDGLIIPVIAFYGILLYQSGCRVVSGPQFDVSLLPLILLAFYFLEKMYLYAYTEIRIYNRPKNKKEMLSVIIAILVLIMSFTYFYASQKRVYGTIKGWFLYLMNKPRIMPIYTSLVDIDKFDLVPLQLERAGGVKVPRWQAGMIGEIVKYITDHTVQKEAVFSFPEHSLYNFLADRPFLGRFNIAVYAHTVDKWKKELLNTLATTPPNYIIFSTKLSNVAKNIGRKEELLPEVIAFIINNYKVVKVVGDVYICKFLRASPISN